MGKVGMHWPLVWWMLGCVCIPVCLPWLALQLYKRLRFHQLKERLNGKVVLITGASSGLGEALAHEFYKAGCQVILCARRTKELERVRDDLLRSHSVVPAHTPVVITLDLLELDSVSAAVEKALSIFGFIDILINNSGVSHRGSVQHTELKVDMQVMKVNYFGQVALTKAVLPHMIKRKVGHIVAVTSIQGKIAIPFRSAYSASKHAFQAFCDSMRPEVAPHNVHVTVVSPGYIQTSMSINALTGNGQRYGVMDETTAGGYSPQYVAEQILKAVVFQEKDIVVATAGPRLAIFLRTLIPKLYFMIMQSRANKMYAAAKSKVNSDSVSNSSVETKIPPVDSVGKSEHESSNEERKSK